MPDLIHLFKRKYLTKLSKSDIFDVTDSHVLSKNIYKTCGITKWLLHRVGKIDNIFNSLSPLKWYNQVKMNNVMYLQCDTYRTFCTTVIIASYICTYLNEFTHLEVEDAPLTNTEKVWDKQIRGGYMLRFLFQIKGLIRNNGDSTGIHGQANVTLILHGCQQGSACCSVISGSDYHATPSRPGNTWQKTGRAAQP